MLDLPDEAGDLAVGADVQVGVDIGRVALAAGGQAAPSPAPAPAGSTANSTSRPVAVSLTKSRRSTGNVVGPSTTSSWSRSKSRSSARHRAPPFIAAAAVSTAATMRTCAPQRHRWLSSSLDDVGARGLRVLEQQRVGAHDHARRAVAALVGEVIDEGLLDGVEPVAFGQALDRQHLLARRRRRPA